MKIRFINYRKAFPHSETVKIAYSGWFWVDSLFDGKMIHINVKYYTIEVDLR